MKKILMLSIGGLCALAGFSKGNNPVFADNFINEYTNKDAYIEHGIDLNKRMAEEGFVLLKNDGTFPIAKILKLLLQENLLLI